MGNLLPGQLANFPTPLWKSSADRRPSDGARVVQSDRSQAATGSTTLWIVPWLLILLIVFVILAIAVWLWRRHRRKIAAGEAEGVGERGTRTVDETAPQEPVPTT